MDNIIQIFKSGCHNLLTDELIPEDASQDELNWLTQDGKLKLMNGRQAVGAEGTVGMIRGLWFGYKVDGSKVMYRKTSTKIQYFNGSTWTDIITGLTATAEYCFANYSSLAGSFTFVNGVDGYWKINNANPGSPISLYDSTKNFHGKILIDSGRTFLWDRNDSGKIDKTGVYGSHIDNQNATVYTQVTGEATLSLTGTLALISGHPTRNCFGIQLTITATGEVYTDDFLGNLKGSLGGTGTINYATGAYTVSNPGVGTVNYQWEDSNIKGVTDFSQSLPRVAGEGFQFPQDEGGDAIQTILIGQDGNYYSLKSQSSYRLVIGQLDGGSSTQVDNQTENKVYRKDIGVPNWRAAVSTNKGIVFMNTANPDKPEMTILQRNPIGDVIEPIILFPSFKFSNYDYSDCAITTWERYVLVSCRNKNSAGTVNDTILLCDMAQGSVDISGYNARMFIKDQGNLYVGSSVTESVYQVFNGFDDEGYPINNFWISKGEKYANLGVKAMAWRAVGEKLKKFRRLRFSGLIDPNQVIEVYVSFDDGGFTLCGTISGKGSYVDYSDLQTVGSNMIGQAQIGGANTVNAYPFMCEIKVKCPKFRKRTIKLVATSIGYVELNKIMDWDLMIFEGRMPARFRSKQHVSSDGLQTNQNYFNS